MIIYLIGPSGAGKTTLAKKFKGKNCVILDADYIRKAWPELGFTPEDRKENNLRTAKIAKVMSDQGLLVIVSMICPYKDVRAEIAKICDPVFIRVDHEGSEGRDDDVVFEEIDGLLFNIIV